MSHYRRANTDGGTYFFTVVSYRRQRILCDELVRDALRKVIKDTQSRYSFTIDAWVLLPDHLHCIWTLPQDDSDFSMRWSLTKRKVSIACASQYRNDTWITGSKKKHRESTIWQRRYWEHQISDQRDFDRHVDYIHYNPVRHGLCKSSAEWSYSTVHRFIKQGFYPANWAGEEKNFGKGSFGE